jgi:hypothetical protein
MVVHIKINREILFLISDDKYFRKLINVKKYVIMFLVSSMGQSFEIAFLLRHSASNASSYKNLMRELLASPSLNYEKEKGRKGTFLERAYKKINEYGTRKDEQSEYLNNTPNLYSNICQVYDQLK